MTILSLYVLLAIASSLGPRHGVGARSVPDVSLSERRVERSDPHARTPQLNPTCQNIKNSISNASAVYAPGTPEYLKDIEHWASSSTEYAACSVEPGNVQDVSTVMKILSKSTMPFAIKGGGHTTNVGFSSTKGVQITMSRFNGIDVHQDSQTVDVGTGLIWDDVYAKLVPMGINVVGGRVTGVGVAGFTLGGGFSWLTNLHGLTVDTIVGLEIVLPSGEILNADDSQNSDLFWGLKGGLNNFGVVTKITLKTFPQTDVWGGTITYGGWDWDKLTALIAKWSASNTDPKANILPTYNVIAGVPVLSMLMFYNEPTPPNGLFDNFLAIPSLTKDIKTRDFLSLVSSSPSNATAGLRGAFNCVSLQTLTPSLLKVIQEQAEYYGTNALLGAGVFISYAVEPFVADWTSRATPSAWPHDKFLSPTNLYFAWPLGLSDQFFHKAIEDTKANIIKAAKAEGQDLSDIYSYPNYALGTDPLESMYGPNVDKLKKLAAKYDPGKVMTRTGGFIFQK